VSDDGSIIPEAERKRNLRDRVARSDIEARAIFTADKIAKVRELAVLPRSLMRSSRYQAKLAHFRASLAMLERVGGDDRLGASCGRGSHFTSCSSASGFGLMAGYRSRMMCARRSVPFPAEPGAGVASAIRISPVGGWLAVRMHGASGADKLGCGSGRVRR
jgi:hypothetical protein